MFFVSAIVFFFFSSPFSHLRRTLKLKRKPKRSPGRPRLGFESFGRDNKDTDGDGRSRSCRHQPPGATAFTWPVQESPPGKLYLWDWSLTPPPGRRCSRTGKRGTRGERRQQASHLLPKDTKNKPNQKEPNTRNNQTKKKKPNMAGGGGQGGGARREGKLSHLSIRLLALGLNAPPPHSETVAWMEGWMDQQRRPPHPPPSPPPPQLWSWMERNANDLTELKSSKRSVFIFLLVGSDCFLLCRFLYCTLVLTTHLE